MTEVIRFGIVGTISTLTLYGIYWLCLFLCSPSIAYTIAYVCAFVVNYLLTTSFTFKVKKSFKNGLGFVGSNVINYFVSIMLLNVFIVDRHVLREYRDTAFAFQIVVVKDQLPGGLVISKEMPGE